MVRRLVDHHEFWADVGDPRHVCYPSGGSRGRAAYLAAVANADRFGILAA
jgi:hypothetical protein